MNIKDLENKMINDGFNPNQIKRIKEIIYFIGIAEDLAWRRTEGVLQEDIYIENVLLKFLKENNIIIENYSKYKKYPIYRLSKQATNIFNILASNFQPERLELFLKDFKKLNQNILCLIDAKDLKKKSIENFDISKFSYENEIDYRVLFRNSIKGELIYKEFNKILYKFRNLIQKYNYYFEITPFQSNLREYNKFKYINDKRIVQILINNENEFKANFGLDLKNLYERLKFFNSMQLTEDTLDLRKYIDNLTFSKKFDEKVNHLSKNNIISPLKFDKFNPYFDIIKPGEYNKAIVDLIQSEIDTVTNPIIDYLLNPPVESIKSEPIVSTVEKTEPTKKEIVTGTIILMSYVTKDADKFNIPKIAEILTSYNEIEDVLYWEEDALGEIYGFMEESLEKCNALLVFCSPSAHSSKPVKKEYRTALRLEKTIIPIFYEEEHIPTLLKDERGVKFDPFNFQKMIDEIYRLIPKTKRELRKKSKEEQKEEKFKLYGKIKLRKKFNISNTSKSLGIEKGKLEDFIYDLVGKNKISGELHDEEFIISSDIDDFIKFLKEYLQ